MNASFNKSCEICGQSNWEILIDNDGPSVCSGREVVQNELSLIKGMCTNCGFVYTLQSPLDQAIDHYYEQVFSSKLQNDEYDYVNYSHNRSFAETLNRFVLSHPYPETGRLLDIGCGKGFFDEAFHERYPGWTIEGVDPSVRSIEIAQSKTPSATFHTRKFEGSDYKPAHYDLVTIHTVLNRVSPRKFLSEASALLKPNGVFSIEIALLSAVPFQMFFADHHCMYFREHVLALAEEFHLELIQEDLEGSLARYLFRKRTEPCTEMRDSLFERSEQIKAEVIDIASNWRAFIDVINEYKRNQKRVSFYGAGTTVMILLSQTDFPIDQIVGIFEDNQYKIGEVMWGVTVELPSEKMKQADAIVLCAGTDSVDVMRSSIEDGDTPPLLYLGSHSCEAVA